MMELVKFSEHIVACAPAADVALLRGGVNALRDELSWMQVRHPHLNHSRRRMHCKQRCTARRTTHDVASKSHIHYWLHSP